MTKKETDLIAYAMRTARDLLLDPLGEEDRRFGAYSHALDIAAEALAEELATTNSRFDRQRFLVACGVGSE